jgi:hypothetical protein
MTLYGKYIKEVIKPSLGISPGLSNETLIPSSWQSDYINTEYFKSLGGIKKIIQFTSLRNLFSIINEGSLRLYNLNNPEDINEYISGANIIFESQNKYKFIKDDLFYASFCKEEDIYDPILWKQYADDGKGICIVYEIANSANIDEWEHYQIGKVLYDAKSLIYFKSLHDAFIKKNNNIDNDNIFPVLKTIFCFYKRMKYSYEKEVRIIGFNSSNSDNFKCDTNRDGKIVTYFPLKLYVNNGANNCDSLNSSNKPILKITRIILGNKVDSSIVIDEKGHNLNEIFRDKFKYDIKPEYYPCCGMLAVKKLVKD